MKRGIIAFSGAMVALGFFGASAVANYLFGESLGRTPHEALLYGIVGVLAVAMNALAPFYISWSLAAKRRITATGIVVLWALCLSYSTTSALGFAAQNRESVAVTRQITQDVYEDIRRELDLEGRRKKTPARRIGLGGTAKSIMRAPVSPSLASKSPRPSTHSRSSYLS
jgi:hypothetical protein